MAGGSCKKGEGIGRSQVLSIATTYMGISTIVMKRRGLAGWQVRQSGCIHTLINIQIHRVRLDGSAIVNRSGYQR